MLITFLLFSQQPAAAQRVKFDDSLFIATHYVEYLTDTDERFARQATALVVALGLRHTFWSDSLQDFQFSFRSRISIGGCPKPR